MVPEWKRIRLMELDDRFMRQERSMKYPFSVRVYSVCRKVEGAAQLAMKVLRKWLRTAEREQRRLDHKRQIRAQFEQDVMDL